MVSGIHRPSALALFRDGLDTVEIARRLEVTEAIASRMIFEERCLGKGRRPRKKIHNRAALLEILSVDIESGEIRWRPRPNRPEWNRRFAGKIAGGINSQGYCVVNINGTHHRAHHIVWTVAHDHWPDLDIDHIDGDRKNNAISNLREVTRAENHKNKGALSQDRLGCLGVERSGRRWRARIAHAGKVFELGHFDDFEEAVAARKRAEQQYGYDPMHGRRLAHGRG